VIAHEMTHGYDDQGSRFGDDGRFEDWWRDEDRELFAKRAQSLVTLIERYRGPDDEPVNGRLTLGENIADFGGLAIAYDAFRNALAESPVFEQRTGGYTPSQCFFLAWATIWRQNVTPAEATRRRRIDPHAPARVRANAAPSNMPEFRQAFAGDKEAMPETRTPPICLW
jgi:putative endopeptidase